MICNNCETENPDGAVYCKNCGIRLDGKTVCPSCGKETPADGKYCIFCGSDTSAKQKPVKYAASTRSENHEKAKALAKTVFNKTALGAALACVLFSLIFVFLIGIVVTVDYGGSYGQTMKNTCDIKFFFGENFENYRDMVETIEQTNAMPGWKNPLTLFPADTMLITYVFQTVILASVILAVIILSIIAAIYTIGNLLGKTRKDGIKFSVAAYLVYVLGTVLLYATLNNSTELTNVSLSSATVAGLTLGGIFAAIAVISKICEQGRELVNTNTIIKYSFAVGGIILFAVVLGLCSAPMVCEGQDKSGFFTINMGIGALFSDREDYQAAGSAFGTVVLGTVAFALVCLIAVCAVQSLVSHVSNLQKGKSVTLPFVIIAFIASIALLVVSIQMGSEFNRSIEFMFGSEERVDFDFAIPIAVLVMTTLALIANAASIIIKHIRKQPKEAPAV